MTEYEQGLKAGIEKGEQNIIEQLVLFCREKGTPESTPPVDLSNERVTYMEDGSDVVDEAILYNASVHLESLSDTCYMLIMTNSRHRFHFSIFSKGGRAHIVAKLQEGN